MNIQIEMPAADTFIAHVHNHAKNRHASMWAFEGRILVCRASDAECDRPHRKGQIRRFKRMANAFAHAKSIVR